MAGSAPRFRRSTLRPPLVGDSPPRDVTASAGETDEDRWARVTEKEAEELWCNVVAPAGGSQFEGDLGTLIYDEKGNWLASSVVG